MTHQAATEAAEASRLCEQESDKYPWVKTLKQYHAGAVARLIALYTDVYNDSNRRLSWPARPLAELWAQSVQSQRSVRDRFSPALHIVHNEVLCAIVRSQMKNYTQPSLTAGCIAPDFDGSADWQIKTARLLFGTCETVLSRVAQAEDREQVYWNLQNLQ